LAVPVRHRDALAAACAGQLTITKHTDGCLLIFPRPAWEPFREKIAALPEEATRWKRFYLGGAIDVEVDASSRVLVPPELRAFAGITKDTMLMGMGKHFELWDAARHAAHEIAVMQQAPPEAVRTLSY
jgi:MraZ protein